MMSLDYVDILIDHRFDSIVVVVVVVDDYYEEQVLRNSSRYTDEHDERPRAIDISVQQLTIVVTFHRPPMGRHRILYEWD